MSIKKQFLKSRPVCKVTFRISKERAGDAETIYLVGDFNDWDTTANPMRQLASGEFKEIVDLELDQEHEFRYLVDQEKWMNEPDADREVATPYPDVKNSVIVT